MADVSVLTRKYRPSNGTEGMDFAARFCDRCVRAPDYDKLIDCDILSRSFWNDLDDPEYPTEWISDGDGQNPRCTAFRPKEQP